LSRLGGIYFKGIWQKKTSLCPYTRYRVILKEVKCYENVIENSIRGI
jgi:hypothetical protein